MGKDPATDAEFNALGPEQPTLETCSSLEELIKYFTKAELIEKRVQEFYDPKRHILVFARWYSCSGDEKFGPTVDDEGKVVFVHHTVDRDTLEFCVRALKWEYNAIYIVDKGAKWSQATKFPSK